MSVAENAPAGAARGGVREPLRRRLARLAARSLRTRTLRPRAATPLVSFTFDDIPASAAARGAALVEAAGGRATFYVAGGLILAGGHGAADPPPAARFASPAQIRDLHARGHEIGCHSFSHRAVSSLRGPALAADVARNRAWLAGLAPGLASENFAYPFNTTSLRAKWLLERRFGSCRGGVPGINRGRIDLGFLRAVELADGFIDPEGIRAWIARAVAERGWLIFFSHGVTEAREPWGCHPDLLGFALDEAARSETAVVSVREALRRLRGEGAREMAGGMAA